MSGSGDSFYKFDVQKIQRMALVILAVLIGVFFISSWPRWVLIFKHRLPQQISSRWFLSFPEYTVERFKKLNADRFFFDTLSVYALSGRQNTMDMKVIDQCIEYYSVLQEQYPEVFSAKIIRGFCEYYKGQQLEAEHDFMSVMNRVPNLFWQEYDLGILCIEVHRPDLADHYFGMALSIPSGEVLKNILASPVYMHLMAVHGITVQELSARLERARERCISIREIIERSSSNIGTDTLNKLNLFVTIF